jgi:hypothetical protein
MPRPAARSYEGVTEIILPDFHTDQTKCYLASSRFNAVRCGRRWGKTALLVNIAVARAVAGKRIGIFAPSYKIINEIWHEIEGPVEPALRSSSETKGVMYTITGGRIEFWTLEDARAGRSRKYNTVLMDEVAFAKPNLESIWELAIRPTLLDYEGDAWAFSTPNGVDEENFFYKICTQEKYGFREYYAPTANNPIMPRSELELLKKQKAPLVFRQEYEAQFVSWAGVQFFALSDLLDDAGQPFPMPRQLDAVFCTIDTAVKTGQKHDSTAVVFWGVSKFKEGPRELMILGYDLVKVEGATLEVWIPSVLQRLEHYARVTRARLGHLGAYIEDKSSGTILLQQLAKGDFPAAAIDSKLTAMGKDERAVSVSGYVYQKRIGLTQEAFDYVKEHDGVSRNHLLSQVFSYQLGVKNQRDDILDCFCYGIAIGLGNSEGY